VLIQYTYTFMETIDWKAYNIKVEFVCYRSISFSLRFIMKLQIFQKRLIRCAHCVWQIKVP